MALGEVSGAKCRQSGICIMHPIEPDTGQVHERLGGARHTVTVTVTVIVIIGATVTAPV